jgi:hypothetical protein
MVRNRYVAVAGFLVLAASGLSLTRALGQRSYTPPVAAETPDASTQGRIASVEPIPEFVPYRFLFRHISILSEPAQELAREGNGHSALLSVFQEETSLDDRRFEVLRRTALQCEQEVAGLDERAKTIIDTFRAHYPPGALPRELELPPPPPELIALQDQRNQAFLRYRDRLRVAFGEVEFARFDAFVQARFAPNLEAPASPSARVTRAPNPTIRAELAAR